MPIRIPGRSERLHRRDLRSELDKYSGEFVPTIKRCRGYSEDSERVTRLRLGRGLFPARNGRNYFHYNPQQGKNGKEGQAFHVFGDMRTYLHKPQAPGQPDKQRQPGGNDGPSSCRYVERNEQ